MSLLSEVKYLQFPQFRTAGTTPGEMLTLSAGFLVPSFSFTLFPSFFEIAVSADRILKAEHQEECPAEKETGHSEDQPFSRIHVFCPLVIASICVERMW